MSGKGNSIETGMRFGRLTVLSRAENSQRGERRWLCRCDCGKEKSILERSLLYGGSKSCGCYRSDRHREEFAYDLTGKVFGSLTVLHKAEHQRKNGGIWWTCRCACGSIYECPATLLVNGRRTHCGCKTNRGRPADIAGRKFNRLTALYLLDERDDKGSVLWRCRCDCGNEVDISYNTLMYSDIQSCGCQKKEHDKMMQSFLTRVDGTSLDIIRSKKLPKDNTTGYKGVYLIRGKYVAKIVFQKKQYHLGAYRNIKDAVEVRRKAESVLFDELVDYYAEYRKYADAHPGWEEENPIRICVDKDGADLSVHIEPVVPIASVNF